MLPSLFLIFAATLFRTLPPLLHLQHNWLMNISPLAAIVFCGALYFPKRMAVWVPLVILVVSDAVLNYFAYSVPFFTWETLPRYVAFIIIGLSTFALRPRLAGRIPTVLGASIAATVLFYLLTNTTCWIADPGYAKNAAGWIQALTVGLPGYAPTWTFFRNSLIGDLLFTGLFIASMSVTHKKAATVPNSVVVA